MPLFPTEEAAGRSSVRLSAWRLIVGSFFRISLVEVASGSGRRQLSGRDGGGWDGRQSGGWGGLGCVSGNLIMGILKVLFKEPDLVLHSGY